MSAAATPDIATLLEAAVKANNDVTTAVIGELRRAAEASAAAAAAGGGGAGGAPSPPTAATAAAAPVPSGTPSTFTREAIEAALVKGGQGLASGWTPRWSPEQGRVFYVKSGERSRWVKPLAASVDASANKAGGAGIRRPNRKQMGGKRKTGKKAKKTQKKSRKSRK